MKRRKQKANVLAMISVASALTALPFAASGPDHPIDFNALMNETQKQSPDPDRVTLVWWLPEMFWEWSLSQESMTEEATEEFLSVLRPYTMLVVLDGKLGPFGGITFVEPGELRKSIVLIDAEGDRYVPLAEGAVSADATNLAVMMKPLLSNMLGPTGENMGFFFLPATTEAGGLIADPLGEGTFTVRVGDQPFEWRTPLSSAIPSKVCPVDGEEMSGAWSYCPWHGKKLGAK